jgi:hypothetical protein
MITVAVSTTTNDVYKGALIEGQELYVLQSILGGNVKAIQINESMTMWVNENCMVRGPEINYLATAVWHAVFGPTTAIVGTVVFAGTSDEKGAAKAIDPADRKKLEEIVAVIIEENKAQAGALL